MAVTNRGRKDAGSKNEKVAMVIGPSKTGQGENFERRNSR